MPLRSRLLARLRAAPAKGAAILLCLVLALTHLAVEQGDTAASPRPFTASASAAPASATPAAAPTLPIPTRIHGVDRYDQAVQASRAGFDRADIVYLASGQAFADALGAGAVAGTHRSPLLLTPRDALPPLVIAEIARLQPTIVVVVGGTASVSDDVLAQLSRSITGATFLRIDGADRYEVSRALVTDPVVGVPAADVVLLAAGAGFADAVAAAPAAVRANGAMLLVNGAGSGLPPPTHAAIRAFDPAAVTLLGGTTTMSAGIESELRMLGHGVSRVSGADRYEVAVALNSTAHPAPPGGTVYLASGTAFPDALSGGPLAGSRGAAIYLVRPTCVPWAVLADLHRLAPREIVLLGGPATLSPSVQSLTPC
ncbi:cell wall-binding repeat-containing protein [Herbiconiux sp.]|uniref:cell wall-binding repeat-containing protein n=1 Tax=Herbiconiux sp. TaxID=1871186 RepID=UPI0025BFB9E4|nr:cell wall-binding repeat-containing protein [Herbiconiux sp.]